MERIHVTVRARPLLPEEAKASPWRISGKSISIPNQHRFEFDQIFSEDCKTAEIYQDRIKDIVSSVVHGFNGTIFAYGQTNSGKTHTMRGSSSEPGIIPLAIHDLFKIIQEDLGREFLVRMSYMEIYNEEINDLLVPEHQKLQIHESLERGIYVAGLREEITASYEQVLNFMESGELHRHTGETNMNLHSSRSHTIFRMIVESRERTEDGDMSSSSNDIVRVSILNLVDLAGSERATKTGAEGARLKEGSHINKSLMTLGTVIKKLSEGAESQGSHVPYRDSKLTRILQPALGGNANTAIICNITLALNHVDETKCSLQFASRALRVTNCAHVNEILTEAALLKRQKKEIEELRAKLQGSHLGHSEEEILNLRNTLLQTELERERIACELEEKEKVQAERERKLQLQAKQIENLSSLFLYSNIDENRDHYKKEKRRETWCPQNTVQETIQEKCSSFHSKLSSPMKPNRNMGPLLHFEELMNKSELEVKSPFMQQECSNSVVVDDCPLPDPRTFLNVTMRKKVTQKENFVENDEIAEMQSKHENLVSASETEEGNLDFRLLLREVQEIVSGVQNAKDIVENMSLLLDEHFQCSSVILSFFVYLHSLTSQTFMQFKSIINDHEKLNLFMQQKVIQLENEKILLYNQVGHLQRQIDDLRLDVQNSDQALREHSERHDLEKSEFNSEIAIRDEEILRLSSCSLAKENKILIRDLENTKVKLKNTDFKLKNAIQEKTKLVGEKIYVEQEVKQLHSQRMLLERDMNKHTLSTRHGFFVDQSSKACDLNKSKGKNKRHEDIIIEMESTISSLKRELTIVSEAKEDALTENETLVSVIDMFNIAKSEIEVLQEECLGLEASLAESDSRNQKWESSHNLLKEEKEELAMQLTNALWDIEEKTAIWSSKEKTYVAAIEEKTKSYNAELSLLSKELCAVRNELESSGEQCKIFNERLTVSEENCAEEKKCSVEKSLEIESLRNHLQRADDERKKCIEGEMEYNKERSKVRMKLHWTTARCDTFCKRYREAADELVYMRKEFEDSAASLKNMLAFSEIEVRSLRQQLDERGR